MWQNKILHYKIYLFKSSLFSLLKESPTPEDRNAEDQSESSRHHEDEDMENDLSSDENDCDIMDGDDVIDVGQE